MQQTGEPLQGLMQGQDFAGFGTLFPRSVDPRSALYLIAWCAWRWHVVGTGWYRAETLGIPCQPTLSARCGHGVGAWKYQIVQTWCSFVVVLQSHMVSGSIP